MDVSLQKDKLTHTDIYISYTNLVIAASTNSGPGEISSFETCNKSPYST